MVTIDDVKAAARMIKGRVSRTPLVHSQGLSRTFGAEVYLETGKPSENRVVQNPGGGQQAFGPEARTGGRRCGGGLGR